MVEVSMLKKLKDKAEKEIDVIVKRFEEETEVEVYNLNLRTKSYLEEGESRTSISLKL